MDQRRKAVHEAGHVVVAHLKELPVQGVTIDSQNAPRGRGGMWVRPPEKWTEELLRDFAVSYMAGKAAEELVLGAAAGVVTYGDDYRRLYELAAEYGDRPPLKYITADAKDEASRLVREHRAAVDAVSEVLLEESTVEAEKLEAVIHEAE